jgi:hypothetical protein
LSSNTWFARQNKSKKKRRRSHLPKVPTVDGVKASISELAYLATPEPPPEDKIRPLCGICPRMMLHLQGECIPGQLVCYKSLDFNQIRPEKNEEKSVEPIKPQPKESVTDARV